MSIHIISMDLEEQYELGQRAGVRLRHPYWDVDLVEFLMRTPPDLLNGKGKSKGLVREALADRFPDAWVRAPEKGQRNVTTIVSLC